MRTIRNEIKVFIPGCILRFYFFKKVFILGKKLFFFFSVLNYRKNNYFLQKLYKGSRFEYLVVVRIVYKQLFTYTWKKQMSAFRMYQTSNNTLT